MTYAQVASTQFSGRLIELSELFEASRDTFHEIADNRGWIPSPGSPAAMDSTVLTSPDPAISSSVGLTGHLLVTEVVQIFLLSASGHMSGLANLYKDSEVLFSPPLLIRAVIENCAHALWVLGRDGEPAENRLARGYLENLFSAEEARKNAGRLLGKSHGTYLRSDAAYRALKVEILARFPGSTNADLGGRLLNGQTLPRLEESVKWMYALTEEFGGTIDQDAASGLYGVLSSLTHPTLYPIREQRRWIDDPETGVSTSVLRVELHSVERDSRAALAAFYNALNYVTSFFGWQRAELAALEAKISAVFPDFFDH